MQGWWRRGERARPRIIELLNNEIWSDVEIDRPLFEANPAVVQFDGYTPCRTYTATVQLRNINKVAHVESKICRKM